MLNSTSETPLHLLPSLHLFDIIVVSNCQDLTPLIIKDYLIIYIYLYPTNNVTPLHSSFLTRNNHDFHVRDMCLKTIVHGRVELIKLHSIDWNIKEYSKNNDNQILHCRSTYGRVSQKFIFSFT